MGQRAPRGPWRAIQFWPKIDPIQFNFLLKLNTPPVNFKRKLNPEVFNFRPKLSASREASRPLEIELNPEVAKEAKKANKIESRWPWFSKHPPHRYTRHIASTTTITTNMTFKENMSIYDERINITFKSWNPATGEEWDNGPCGKCHPQACLDDFNGYTVWQCHHGDWFVEQDHQEVSADSEHLHTECPGHCSQHPLVDDDYLIFAQRMRAGGPSCTAWGNIMYEEEQAALSAETPAQKQARLEAQAEHERKSKEGIVKYLVHRKEEKWTKGGKMKFREPRPCKYATLYAARTCSDCGAKVPEGATVCKAMTRARRVCDQEFAGCWNHEQTRTCIYVHPDEPQWADACSGALCYDRKAECFHLRGAEPAEVNRFQAAARQEGMRPQSREHNHSRHAGGGQRHDERQRQERQGDGWEQAKRSRR